MGWAPPGHQHPQHRQEHRPEDHLLDGAPPLMPDQPPDSSNCRDQEQGNDHALIVVVVTGPCKPPLRPRIRPEGRASAPHDSPSSSGQTQARQPLTMTAGTGAAPPPARTSPNRPGIPRQEVTPEGKPPPRAPKTAGPGKHGNPG